MVEAVVTGEPQHRGGCIHLLRPAADQLSRVGRRVGGSLVPRRADDDVHLGAGPGPPGQRAPARHLGIVGVGVHREDLLRGRFGGIRHGRGQ